MKLQDVILKAIAKKITWLDAADIAGFSARTMDSLRQKYAAFGYDGLYDQHGRRRIVHRIPLPVAERVLALYQHSYAGMNPWRFHQKLRSEQSIEISYTWLLQALRGAGLIAAPEKRRDVPRPRAIAQPAQARRRHFVRSRVA